MRKIMSLFQRNYASDRLVRNEVVPGAEWVLAGEGYATRKVDGTCCMIRQGRLWKRYELKQGQTAPPGFLPAQDPDPVTGNTPGWLLVSDGPEDRWHRDALARLNPLIDGTYELLGPKIQGNPEHLSVHVLWPHGQIRLDDCPRDYAALKAYLAVHDIEGIVWHHPDGRMVKIKGRDFGLRRQGSQQ